MVKNLLELLLQGFGALVPEMSLFLAVVTTVISPFCVIGHPDGGGIDLSVEYHFYVVPVRHRIVIIDVLWDVVFFSLNLHDRLHLCGVDGDIRVVVGVLPEVSCLILLHVIQLMWVRVCVVGSVRGLLMD